MSEREVNPAAADAVRSYEPAAIVRDEHAEGPFTLLIEQHTARVPSHVFLFASFTAMGASLALEIADHPRLSRLAEMAANTLLIMGVYNKLVKSLGPR